MSPMPAVVLLPARSPASAPLLSALTAGLGEVSLAATAQQAAELAAARPRAPLVLDLRAADVAALADARSLRLRLPDARVLALVAPGVPAPPDCDAVLTEPFYLVEVVRWCARAEVAPLAEGLLSDLAAGLSHEVGNPLTALLLQLELLKTDRNLEGIREHLQLIEDSSRRIQEVVRDVAAAAERLPVAPVATRLTAVLGDARQALAGRAPALPARLRVRCSDGPLRVERPLLAGALADLWQYLLLAGGPDDTLAVHAGPGGHDAISIRAAARVPRLPPDAAARLFTPLWARQALGLPAGLSLTGARAAFRRHGGELRVLEQRGARLLVEALLPAGAGA